MASLNQFSRNIKLRAKELSEGVSTIVRKVALAADQAVVQATPVDTGRARSNWIVQLGAGTQAVREPYSPGAHGSTAAANTQAALDQGAAAIAGYRGEGQEIHITNNLPYIGRLNDGYSRQAPANFVEMAVLEAADAVAKSHL